MHKQCTIMGTQKNSLYPVGHSPLLSSDEILKVATFQKVRTKRDKRLLICLLPSADDVQTSPAQVHGAKVQIYFGLCK